MAAYPRSRSAGRRKLAMALLVALIGIVLGAAGAAAAQIAWQTDVERALATARSERRAVLLDFWADWCAPCHAMDREFWSRQDVAALSRRLIPVRVDYDRNQGLALKHGVGALPAVVVLDPWQNPIAGVIGFGKDTRQLDLLLQQIPEDFAPAEPWAAALQKDDKDFAALRGLGEFYFRHTFLKVSTHYYERALKTAKAKDDARARGDLLVALGWNRLHMNDGKRAHEELTRALEVPDLERADVALFGLVAANVALGRRVEAQKVFAQLSSRFPDSQATRAARERLQSGGASP